jgi:hypothetical protein
MCAGRDANRPINGGAHALPVQLNGPAERKRHTRDYALLHQDVQVEHAAGALPGTNSLADYLKAVRQIAKEEKPWRSSISTP